MYLEYSGSIKKGLLIHCLRLHCPVQQPVATFDCSDFKLIKIINK